MKLPKFNLGWVKSHKLETVAIVFGVGLLFYFQRRGAFLAGMPSKSMGMAIQRTMMNAPSLVKPQMPRAAMRTPEEHTEFDMRFEMDRMRHGAVDFRDEFSDSERERFLPQILSARGVDIPLIEFIFGLGFNEEIADEECLLQPNAPGIWSIGTNGCWFQVNRADAMLIDEISRLRSDRHQTVIVQ